MSSVLFGQALSRFVRISSHDVNEILEDQTATRRRFGEIALAWGLCTPEQVWQAWNEQLGGGDSTVQLDTIGVDSQAVSLLPTEVAHRLGVVPIRCFGNTLVVATSEVASDRTIAELRAITGKEPRFVRAEAHQIQRALVSYFPAGPAAA